MSSFTAPNGLPFEIGCRVQDADGCKATVRYIGPVAAAKNKTETWLGVEWDFDWRGKHDGSCVDEKGDMHVYFKCPQGAGSFVKPSKVSQGRSLHDALLEKYVSIDAPETVGEDSTIPDASVSTLKGNQKSIEFVGEKKLRKWQQLPNITSVTIRNELVSHLGDAFSSIGSHLKEIDMQDNLLHKWEEVFKLGEQVPALSVLLLHGNRLEAAAPLVAVRFPTGCFRNLRVLALNFCNIHSWAEVQAMEPLLPALQELYVANNRFPDLPRHRAEQEYRLATGLRDDDDDASGCGSGRESKAGLPVVRGFANLRVVDMSSCDLEEWSQVLALGVLPRLEECVIDSNPKLTEVLPPVKGTFESLVRFSISSCGINSWGSLDMLSGYSSLQLLRLNQIPLFSGRGASEVRPFVISRIKQLTFFNGSAISARERIDSEKIYLRSILRERDSVIASTFSDPAAASAAVAEAQAADAKNAAAAAARGAAGEDVMPCSAVDAELAVQHPRFKELQRTYAAELLPVGAQQAGHTIASDLINVTFRNLSFGSGGTLEPITKKLPKSLTIQKLRMLVKQLFGLDAKLQDLSLRLYKDAVPFVIDDEESTLMYYGAIEGSDIFINDAKK